VCGDLEAASQREWLVSDGCGGFAMGTVAGLRTRRYHGLLVAAGDPVGTRRLLLADLVPVLVLGDTRIPLGTREVAAGQVGPAGHRLLTSFTLDDGVPRWRWQIGGVVVEREVAMVRGRPAVGVVHRVVHAPGRVLLELTALCAERDAHDAQAVVDLDVEATADGLVVGGAYRLQGRGFAPLGTWGPVWLREEAARGEPPTESLLAAGAFCAELTAGEALEVQAWTGDLGGPPPPATAIVEDARARARLLAGGGTDPLDAALRVAADAFVVMTPTGPGIIAGYPWFGEWSRDSMLSLDGLLLATGRHDEARAVLGRWAATLSQGMLANTTDTGTAEHNTIDGTLWFVHAVGRYTAATGDTSLAAALLDDLDRVIAHHVTGTRFGIRVDADGLLGGGEDGWALTWMDARYEERCITPRIGKPVEVQALWINALGTVEELRLATTGATPRWEGLADHARRSFAARFPQPGGGLRDLVDGPTGGDGSLRPNQLLAVSLPHGPSRDPSIVVACRDALLTPLGLRTLAPADPAYRGTHHGPRLDRDEAYHQGTVWPWLLGPYVEAGLRAGVDVRGALDALPAHLREWGLGSVSETAEGDPPHAGTGCPFQAWSVAEVLRARRLLTGTAPTGAARHPGR
jgi:glycogen debranching enzyme